MILHRVDEEDRSKPRAGVGPNDIRLWPVNPSPLVNQVRDLNIYPALRYGVLSLDSCPASVCWDAVVDKSQPPPLGRGHGATLVSITVC